jgi:hypothetical protein
MKGLFCDWLLSCAIAAAPVTPLPDLYYGTVLYSYYQDDTSQALLDAMVAQQRNQLGDDPVRYDLAKGSFAFAEGMYQFAEQTFAGIADAELKPIDRMRLSFHLAREYFRREDWNKAAELIKDVDLGKSWLGRERFHPEVEFMRAELATRAGDWSAARTAIDHIDAQSAFHAYARFNLGVAQRAAGDLDGAAESFTKLSELDVYTEEALDLKQRSLLALAFIRRAQTETTSAEYILGALPSRTRYRDLAMSSYGGLAMDTGDYKLAARVWMTLADNDYWTQSSAAARLALPMSLEQMSSRELALSQYRTAEAMYEARVGKLTNLVAKVDDPAWMGELLQVFAAAPASADEDEAARRQALMDQWRETFGHTDWLEWLAAEDVHELLLQWRELKDISDWLNALPEELATFDGLTKEQRRRSAAARELITAEGLTDRRAAIAAEISALNTSIAAMRAATPERTTEWMLKLADPDQAARLRDLAEKRSLVQTHAKPAEQPRLLARIDRIEGLLFWEFVETRPERLRELDKALREAQALATDVDERLVRITRAENEFSAGVETDFLAFQSRADDITRQVALALNDRQTRLADQVRNGIRREVAQLERHLLITRMAIARATDALALSADGEARP